jgi:hypothetical protein
VKIMNVLGGVALGRVHPKKAHDVNTPDEEHAIFLPNLTYGFGGEMTLASRNAARLELPTFP